MEGHDHSENCQDTVWLQAAQKINVINTKNVCRNSKKKPTLDYYINFFSTMIQMQNKILDAATEMLSYNQGTASQAKSIVQCIK